MVTVCDAEEDMVEAREAGAHDYITKPFRFGELVARLRAVLRRAGPDHVTAPSVLQAGNMEIDFERRILRRAGQEIHLSPTEFDLLAFVDEESGIPPALRKALANHLGTGIWRRA